MDHLDAMNVFTRIVEARSFTQVANDLGLPRSTLTDAIKRLEDRLGVSLLHRTTRVVRPTLDGEEYYLRCLSILSEVEDAESAFSGAKPKGKLVDLVREGVDCVLRVGAPADSDLIIRKLTSLEEVTCASPAYLDRFGTPQTLAALDGHRMVGFKSTATGAVLPLEFVQRGELKTVTLPAPVTVTSADTLVECARLGLGLIQKPRYSSAADLASGRLIEVLGSTPPPSTPVSILYPRARHQSARVRAFIDWSEKALKVG